MIAVEVAGPDLDLEGDGFGEDNSSYELPPSVDDNAFPEGPNENTEEWSTERELDLIAERFGGDKGDYVVHSTAVETTERLFFEDGEMKSDENGVITSITELVHASGDQAMIAQHEALLAALESDPQSAHIVECDSHIDPDATFTAYAVRLDGDGKFIFGEIVEYVPREESEQENVVPEEVVSEVDQFTMETAGATEESAEESFLLLDLTKEFGFFDAEEEAEVMAEHVELEEKPSGAESFDVQEAEDAHVEEGEVSAEESAIEVPEVAEAAAPVVTTKAEIFREAETVREVVAAVPREVGAVPAEAPAAGTEIVETPHAAEAETVVSVAAEEKRAEAAVPQVEVVASEEFRKEDLQAASAVVEAPPAAVVEVKHEIVDEPPAIVGEEIVAPVENRVVVSMEAAASVKEAPKAAAVVEARKEDILAVEVHESVEEAADNEIEAATHAYEAVSVVPAGTTTIAANVAVEKMSVAGSESMVRDERVEVPHESAPEPDPDPAPVEAKAVHEVVAPVGAVSREVVPEAVVEKEVAVREVQEPEDSRGTNIAPVETRHEPLGSEKPVEAKGVEAKAVEKPAAVREVQAKAVEAKPVAKESAVERPEKEVSKDDRQEAGVRVEVRSEQSRTEHVARGERKEALKAVEREEILWRTLGIPSKRRSLEVARTAVARNAGAGSRSSSSFDDYHKVAEDAESGISLLRPQGRAISRAA